MRPLSYMSHTTHHTHSSYTTHRLVTHHSSYTMLSSIHQLWCQQLSSRQLQLHADFVAEIAALCEPPCADFVAGAALCEPPCADFVAGAALCEPPWSQISWQAQHFVHLHVQISWQAQYKMRCGEIAKARNAVFFNGTGGSEAGKSRSAERRLRDGLGSCLGSLGSWSESSVHWD